MTRGCYRCACHDSPVLHAVTVSGIYTKMKSRIEESSVKLYSASSAHAFIEGARCVRGSSPSKSTPPIRQAKVGGGAGSRIIALRYVTLALPEKVVEILPVQYSLQFIILDRPLRRVEKTEKRVGPRAAI